MASTYTPLTDDWTQVSAGVATLQVRGGTAYIATGMAIPPPEDTMNCFVVENTFSYSGNENIYVKRAYNPPATEVGVVVDTGYIT